jgi:hypothetical protein
MIEIGEIPLHPALRKDLKIIGERAPDQVPTVRTIFDQLQQQLIKNCRSYTVYDDKGDEEATILLTHVSSTEFDLPEQRFPANGLKRDASSLSSSEEILNLANGTGLSMGIMPGFAFPGQGGPFDRGRILQAADIVGHTLARQAIAESEGREKPDDTTVFIHGLVRKIIDRRI